MKRNWKNYVIQHPVIDGVACGVAFFVISTILISVAFPALAVSIPITERFVIDLGDLPPWIAAIVAIAVYWEARKAKQHAAEAVAVSKDVAIKVDGVLADRDKGKVAEGEKKAHEETAAAKDVASADAVRDAGTAASISAIAATTPPNGTKKP